MKKHYFRRITTLILFSIAGLSVGFSQTAGITSGGVYTIKSKPSGRNLEVNGMSTANSANVQIWDAANHDFQKWRVDFIGSNLYTFTNVGSGKLLHIANATPANNVNVDQYDDTGNNLVRWAITDEGSGYYSIKSAANTGFVADAYGTANGANVGLWGANGGDNQRWSFNSPVASGKTAYLVANSHMDTQWDWPIPTTIEQYIKNTADQNFALFKKYPDYKFNFEGAIKYMWLKEYYPDLYAQLKTYIASGQWNIAGSSLDANDVNIPSPESQIRSILIGQTFYKREFNKKGNDIFLPDCFGFGYTLPTIMRHCGLKGFSTQKLSWGAGAIVRPFLINGNSVIGAWQGVDGSKVLTASEAGDYGQQYTSDVTNNSQLLNWANETGNQTGGKYTIAYHYYGNSGDRGGAPLESTVSTINSSLNGSGPVKVKFATSGQLYDDYFGNINDFPNYNGELLMTEHGTGGYTSQAMMKRWNRKNELLADAAEKSAVVADWLGGLKYPATELNSAWTSFLVHQFHDDLPGTCVPKAYTYSHNDEVVAQNKFSNVLQNAVGAGVRSLNTQATGTPVVVYNPLSIAREDIAEATITFGSSPAYIRVFNKSGAEVPAQILSKNGNTVKFIFVAAVPSLGYEVFDAQPSTTAPASDANLKISTGMLENSMYKVTISNGDISSIVDKSNGNRELLSGSIRLGLFKDYSYWWPSWEVMFADINAGPRAYVDGSATISIEEQGPVRVTLKVSRTKESSTFVQYIRLTNCEAKKRIDIETNVDWKNVKTLLKAVFPLSPSNANATYDLGIGVIKRPNNTSKRYEVPAQQWADISNGDNSYGVSILNDCKYGWDKPSDNTLRLSLIHTPELTDRYPYQQYQDIGIHKFTYSIYGHTNNCMEAGSTWEAAKLNQPMLAFETVKHDGNLGKSFSMVSVSSSQVTVKALKKAENSNDYVIRLYENKGSSISNVKITFPANITNAKELNGIEEEIGSASYSGNSLTISMNAFQPKTFSVTLAAPASALSAPQCNPLTLACNADVITNQSNMNDGNFDGQTNSYAAELLPATISADGINFNIGNKNNGNNNVIKCSGNKIAIPAGYKKLYILAASANTGGSTDKFLVGSSSFEFYIPYFSNFVGQGTLYELSGGKNIYGYNYVRREDLAWTGTHMHNGSSGKDKYYSFTYLFKYCITLPAGATELTLPNNNSIVVFAVTAANNANDDTKPSSELMDIPANSANAPAAINGATVYQNCNYDGYSAGLAVGDYPYSALSAAGIANDDISSIRIPSGYKAILYSDDNYGGSSTTLTGDNTCLADIGWNDMVTSMKVRPNGVTGMNGTYSLQNRNSSKYMDVSGGSVADGAIIVQWPGTGGTNQQFAFNDTGDGAYSITNVNSGKAVDINAGSYDNLATVLQWTYGGGNNQRFILLATDNSYYKFKVVHSGRLIEVSGGSTADGAAVVQYDDNNQSNGQWKLNAPGSKSAQIVDAISDASSKDISIFPNPATDMITLTSIPANTIITVSDLYGRELQRIKSSVANGDVVVDVSSLLAGAYFIKIGDSKTFKLLKR